MSNNSGKIKFTANYRRNYVAALAVLLFFLIIAGEIFLAVAVPVVMRNEDLMSNEANRNDLLLLFDYTRNVCSKISGKNAEGQDDAVLIMEKQLLSDALDKFARYMREEGDQLSPQEVKEIEKILRELSKVAAQLSKGRRFSKENRINTAGYINNLLKQTCGDTPNAGTQSK